MSIKTLANDWRDDAGNEELDLSDDCRAALMECAKELDARLADEPALQQQGEAVGWHTEDHLTDRSATTYDKAIADRWVAKGWPVTPLYTHPPKPVVSDEMVNAALDGFNEAAGDGEPHLTSHRDSARMRFALIDALGVKS